MPPPSFGNELSDMEEGEEEEDCKPLFGLPAESPFRPRCLGPCCWPVALPNGQQIEKLGFSIMMMEIKSPKVEAVDDGWMLQITGEDCGVLRQAR